MQRIFLLIYVLLKGCQKMMPMIYQAILQFFYHFFSYEECLFKCGLLCGKLGGSKLLEKYDLQFPNSNPEKTGSNALQILQKKSKITNKSSSMAKLHQTLISINLFRAGKMIKGYLTGKFQK